MPERIQRKRTKGWCMPPNTVYVGRPTMWGNRFTVVDGFTPEQAVEMYRKFIGQVSPDFIRSRLKGMNLACWCPLDQPCHADVLLEIANE